MIQFNELKLVQDGEKLIIDVSVINHPYYKDIYINEIRIDTQDTYSGLGPSTNPVYSYVVEQHKNLKIVRLALDEKDFEQFDMEGKLFFVYITARGLPSADAPLNSTKVYQLKTVSDLEPIYKASIKLISGCENPCDDQTQLIDHILKMNSLDLALKTCNYPIAIKYWNKFFKHLKINKLNKK